MKKKCSLAGRASFGLSKEILLKMKLTALLFLIGFMHVFAAKTYSQSTRLSMELRDVTLVDVLKEIESKSEFYFVYNKDAIDLNRKVNLNVKERPINNVLDLLFKDTKVNYRIIDRHIILSTMEPALQAEQAAQTIRGSVSGSDGLPIPGVSVSIKGTSVGTITDSEGAYSIPNVPANSTLVFSFVGMKTVEVKVGTQTKIDVKLQEESVNLEEVVAVGYGTQKKVNLTGSVASISADKLGLIPVSNISNAMAGRMPGLFSMNKSSNPGTSSDITIRGVSTVNTTSPLYVIDGVVRDKADFDGLDPNSIETISILKDAASSSVYGSRAANGVILVNTKRGKVQKATFSYSFLGGTEELTKDVKMMNAHEYGVYTNKVLVENGYNNSYAGYFTDDELDYFKTHSTNWWDLCTKTPFTQQHNLNVRGGSETVRYLISTGYYNQNGLLIGGHNSYDRYNLVSNVDVNLTKSLSVSVDVDVLRSIKDTPFWPYNSSDDYMDNLYQGVKNCPSYMPASIGGLYDKTFYGWNPVAVLEKAGYKNHINNTTNAKLAFKYTSTKINGLSVEGMFNYRYYDFKQKFVSQAYKLYSHKTSGTHNHIVTEDAEVTSSTVRSDGDYITKYNTDNASYTLNLKVNYNRTFGKHDVGAMFIYEQYEDKNDYFWAQRKYLQVEGVEQLWSGSSNYQYSNGNEGENGRLGYIGRLNYGYDSKYLFEGNFRYDGSMVFSKSNRWGFFPSVSAAWRISQEPFIKDNYKLSFIDNLKIRGSYGILGNDQTTTFQWQQKYNMTTGGVFGSGTGIGSNAVSIGTYPNPNITWEQTATLDLGFDANLWKGLLGIEADYFQKRTTNVFRARERSVPGTFGASLPKENYAEIKNHGFEVTLSHENKIGEVKYNASFNLSFARNKWVVVDESSSAASYDYLRLTGRPISFLTGYEAVGIARTEADLQNAPTYQGAKYELGDLILKDQDGDKNITSSDQVVLSKLSGTPEIIYGFSLGAVWKNFDISMFFQGVGNRKVMSPIKGQAWGEQTSLAVWNDTWSASNPNAALPKVGGKSSAKNARSQNSSFWVRDASFLRMKNLEIGYTMPKNLINKIGLQNCRVFFTGTNLFLLRDKIKTYDPENTASSGAFQYPSNRTYNVGVNISF